MKSLVAPFLNRSWNACEKPRVRRRRAWKEFESHRRFWKRFNRWSREFRFAVLLKSTKRRLKSYPMEEFVNDSPFDGSGIADAASENTSENRKRAEVASRRLCGIRYLFRQFHL